MPFSDLPRAFSDSLFLIRSPPITSFRALSHCKGISQHRREMHGATVQPKNKRPERRRKKSSRKTSPQMGFGSWSRPASPPFAASREFFRRNKHTDVELHSNAMEMCRSPASSGFIQAATIVMSFTELEMVFWCSCCSCWPSGRRRSNPPLPSNPPQATPPPPPLNSVCF